MSTVIRWRSFVSIRISIFLVGFAAAIAAFWCTAKEAGAQTSPAAAPPGSSRAAAPSAPATTGPGTNRMALSLPEAIRRAMEQAPEVVNAQHDIRQAEARRIGAGVIMPTN